VGGLTRRRGGGLNALNQAFWQIYRSRVNVWRRDVLGLDRVPFLGPSSSLRCERQPVLYGYSSTVVPKPADTPAREGSRERRSTW
jgi:hypothetical protein